MKIFYQNFFKIISSVENFPILIYTNIIKAYFTMTKQKEKEYPFFPILN